MMRFMRADDGCGLGPRMRAPRRRKNGALDVSRIVMLLKVMSSTMAPSTVFEREAAAAFEDAVGDGDVLEAAVGLGAELDAACARSRASAAIRFQVPSSRVPFVDAGDVAVGDGEVLCGARVAEGVASSSGRCRRPTAS